MATNGGDKKVIPEDLENDNRDVADLWKQALKEYKGIVGFDLQPKFNNVQAMIDFGTNEMNSFHKFRHNTKKVDKLRSLFAANIDYIEKGAQHLISAAVPAFPPAAAIGTAITYLLSVMPLSEDGCGSGRISKTDTLYYVSRYRPAGRYQQTMMSSSSSLTT
jgi:hypothetical protein